MTKTRVRVTSGLLWVLLSLLSFYHPAPAKAEIQSGVEVTVYNNYGYNNAPPLPPQRPIVGTLVQSQILNYFDQQPLFNMYEDFVVKYEGFLTVPTTGTYQFYAPADDGVRFYLDGQLLINDWYDKGGGGSVSQEVTLTEGVSVPFTLWFYENGGGAWVQFWWIHEGMWDFVPESAFTTRPVDTTTSLPATTTTEEPTTTTTSTTTTTTVPETTTTVPPTTISQLVSPTTSTAPVQVAVSTTTTVPVPTTSTTLARPVTTTTSTTLPPQTSTTQISSSSSTTIPPVTDSMKPDEALLVATSPDTLQDLSATQAQEVFSSVEVSSLTDEQANALVEAVQDAPQEVRAEFEDEINIFGGKFDSYVPLGSKVSVKTRKVIVAASGVLFMAPTVSVSSATTSSSSSSSDTRKRK